MKKLIGISLVSFTMIVAGCKTTSPGKSATYTSPAPYGALPNEAQLKWHEMDMYAFVHFTVNTFTNKEWGYGDEDPAIFNPTAFNADQIVAAVKSAGLTGLILTCKHHDGFCLWPTKTTEHNISQSPWKNGKGDMVKEFADACKKQGIKFGVYLSPWDRNNKNYGTPEYVNIYRAQYRELLTQYGPVFETWHDGANGGDGYYDGARESRKIDRSTYYDWPLTWKMEKDLQPGAVVMSDVGPDVRWVGTESGFAGDPCWATYTPHGEKGNNNPAPGLSMYEEGLNGTRNGKFWMPAETNYSIRPGWFYHQSEDSKVKTPQQLMDHYFASVGVGTSMLLNVPPDKRGLVNEIDAASLKEFGELLKEMYSVNYAKGATVKAADIRNPGKEFAPENVLDDDPYTYWGTKDNVTASSIELDLKGTRTFNVIRLRENIKLGQRIEEWAVDIWQNDNWVTVQKGAAIGHCRLIRSADLLTTSKVRVRITKGGASICLSDVALFKEPLRLAIPTIERDKSGNVTISTPQVFDIRYTLDGTDPLASSPLYKQPFVLPEGGVIKARAFNSKGRRSDAGSRTLGIVKKDWTIAGKLSEVIDDDDKSNLMIPFQQLALTVDMGHAVKIRAFTYLPVKSTPAKGLINRYKFYTSENGKTWEEQKSGEFSNIKANPVEQRVDLSTPVTARYFRFVPVSVIPADDNSTDVGIAELGIIQ
jgi:alpha-L-fucosidase